MTDHQWNLTELYRASDDPQIEHDLQAAEQAVDAFVTAWQPRTAELADPAVLASALAQYEALYRSLGAGDRPVYYLELSRAINQNDTELKARAISVNERRTQLRNRLTFFELAIGQIAGPQQSALLKAPSLEPYRVWLQRRFEQAIHDLPAETTSALNLILPQAWDAWETMIEELLSQSSAKLSAGGQARTVPFNELPQLLASADERLVDEAGRAMTDVMRRVAPVAEREINAIVTTNLRLRKLQGYDRPDAGRFQTDDLDAEVAEAMLGAVEQKFKLAHRFYAFKARLLGRRQFAYHERATAYGHLPTAYGFDQACQLLGETLAALHPDFKHEFDRALRDGHIDALPRSGRRGGAACWNSLLEHPTYLLLNFTGQVRDVQTLGHEFGHYLNNRYMQKGGRCNGLTFGVTIPMAEVASTFFEKYVLEAIASQVDDEARLALQVSSLDAEISTIFRQTAAMRFEQALYAQIGAKGYVSYEQIGQLFQEHMSAYLGPAVTMDDGAGLWWIYWGHFRANFYNYGYTFAMMVAKALQAKLAADSTYITEIQRLLSTGEAERSRVLLHSLGLDISSQAVWNLSLQDIQSKLDQAEALAAKLGALKK